jgi:hypothetical protein
MKHLAWLPIAYLAVTAFANYSPSTFPTVSGLPDVGFTLAGQTGVTAAGIDLAVAGAIYFFVIH